MKQDQLAYKYLRQIEDHKELTQDSFNYLVELLRSDSPTGLPIQHSRSVDTKPFDYAISHFVAPLYHQKGGQSTVLCVSFQYPRKENPGRGVVKAQHYDPDPHQHKVRHTEVGDKIRSWVEQRPGSNVELRFTHEVIPVMKPRPPNIYFDGLGGTGRTTVEPECNRHECRYGGHGLQCPSVYSVEGQILER